MLFQFAATLFVSAFLLFLIQPMIAQMILPRLGGTPAVWNTCMVFFQAALLAGYGYTHSATTHLPVRRQTILQLILLALPIVLLTMPFSIGDWTPATQVNPIWSVLYILLVTVGLPFLVVATSAPLLQRWFASTGHASSKDPYFLYGASNLGSMLALISYPLFFQRYFELPQMAWIWMGGYVVLLVMVSACGLIVWRLPQGGPVQPAAPEPTKPLPVTPAKAEEHVTRRPIRQRPKTMSIAQAPPIFRDVSAEVTWPRRLRWIGLAAAPSSLMLGVTTYITTDIAAIPLFWIVPLALYLLSFILVFARWPWIWTGTPHRLVLYTQLIFIFNLGFSIVGHEQFDTIGSLLTRFVNLFAAGERNFTEVLPRMINYLLAYFACVMACHGELAKDRPPAKNLTEFYLWMSVGGVLGGIFNSLIAPFIFTEIVEYFLVLIAVLFLRPQTHFLDWIRKKKDSPDDHSFEEYLLDIGYAVCLTLLAWGLLKLSLHPTLWQYPNGDSRNLTQYIAAKYKSFFSLGDARYSMAHWTEMFLTEGIPVLICLAFAGRPLRLGLAVVGLVTVNYFMLLHDTTTNYIHTNRSFFSVQKVRQETSEKNKETYNVLIHGTIDHGRQNIDPDKRDKPISYFLPTNPIGQVFTRLKQQDGELRAVPIVSAGMSALLNAVSPSNSPAQIFMLHEELKHQITKGKNLPFAVVGLGVGTLASYANPGQTVHFYEIDPAVVRLSGYVAKPSGELERHPVQKEPIFYYLHDALEKRGVNLRLYLGDGRLKMQEEKEKGEKDKLYQVIVLDAFSSDAIPVHLLTTEAISMYLDKLRDDGILVFNITNRYVRMAPVLADAAEKLKLVCLQQGDRGDDTNPESFGTDWVIMFRKKSPEKMALDLASIIAMPSSGMISSPSWSGLEKFKTTTNVVDLGADRRYWGRHTERYYIDETSMPPMPKIDFPETLPLLLDEWRWYRPKGTGRPPWTDHFQDLIRVMNW